jgi:hypothetical protein
LIFFIIYDKITHTRAGVRTRFLIRKEFDFSRKFQREKEEIMGTDFANNPNQDFLGFSYGRGWHSIRNGHIWRTSDGSRYNTNLIPTLTDKTIDAPGNDGQYYFNSFHKNRTFSISFAFDELTESGIRGLQQLFNGKDIKELIFDERPYVAYDAKVTGTPTIKAICFDDKNGNRVYKGEGTI